MIVVACSWFHVLTELRVDKDETSTDGATEVIWLLVRLALALPRVANVSPVIVWMLDVRAAKACRIKCTWL